MSINKISFQKQEQALIDFLNKTCGSYEDRVDIDSKSISEWHSIFRSLIKPFGFEIIEIEDRSRKEDDTIVAITKAMRQLKRIGKRASVSSISKIVRMNRYRCRQLMVKYGMFDTDTKQIKNILDDWQDMPEW